MVITYYGATCFKIQSGETVLAVDPYAKESGLTPPRFQTDIAISTRNHPLSNNMDALAGNPFIVTSPGEYEIKGVSIEGVATGIHTLYIVELEGMRLCHLGALDTKELPDATRERIGTLDILFVPVGGTNALDAEEAVHMINLIEPRIAIPMYYAFPGFSALALHTVDMFLKEIGSTSVAEEKLTLKKKDVPQDEMKVVVLKPVAGD
ncbi:MAG: hypothetical protein A3J54_00070 [Candidatus Ryanbacteria bacterium RIFCSPHIGHO2_02_FULL_45_13b]|uniref:Lactamase n=1 Tax=Candidatus Ryanbacteria bacterium RIFCSPHIGHO2_02_FULL_45_13b TaxID=1802117 RepID=A0A1G2G9G7_9BACT|nr:MAG: hypothetical protein A3J54_00070 [Candidatus Ryanbacteria bacterium RIFCSPHIGHO2_02_FULL_45_13b]